ncbi:MAG: ABC transporter permease [Algoriphagus sp.]|uniref:ABC transporter permease n=1 Tax=Algoriphagus sp. TaxID=1872435 RepID=UPI00271AC1AA|nr:ABC transporter permease [Algoriphagus sp.]MDO8965722.1 ABC transporter permease [Algoriphagus sp.]MDP2040111.1 ABC transporter permease [Algoriphagus sp.]MDP3202415.1 ABC transporter permease [Algoriphagus sp.]MDP3470562.1 ABC transporter permease [Algoriphagus sp.]
MWKNYLKVSFRNLKKRKLYSGINLLGLTIALVSFFVISLYIHHEWSYDRMYSNADRIYKFNQEFVSGGEKQLVGTTPSSLVPTLIEEFPEVETGTLVFDLSIFSSVMVNAGEGNQEESRFAFVDENFYQVFDFKIIAGQRASLLNNPNQLVLTESTAKRYFGSAQNAEGKSLKINDQEYLVTGVMENFPSNSHLDFDFLASFKTHRHGKNPEWSPSNYYSYVKLRADADLEQFKAKLPKMVEKYLGEAQKENGFETAFYAQPVTKIHLGDQSLSSVKPGTDIRYLYIFGLVALLLIAIGIINYVNLATAEATERNKEVGLRKVMGADRLQLFGQFVSESLILTAGAAVLSLLIIYLVAPQFAKLGGVPLDLTLLFSVPGILALAGLVLTVGFLSGLYPSVILSGLEPIKALGNKVKIGGGAWVRKSLVVFQFFVSIGLLISTFVVKTQLDYMQEVNLGYQKEQVVALPYHYNMRKSIETLKQEMLRTGAVESIALASDMPIFIKAGYRIFPGGDNQNEFMITGYSVDKDLVKTIGLEILEGENFLDTDLSRTMAYDSSMEYPVILNESALQQLGWNAGEAIGRKVNFGGGMAHVKGVVKNFYFNSLHHGVGPLAIFIDPEQANVLLLRLPAGNPAVHLARLEQTWKEMAPDRPFNYKFVDQEYAQLYRSEERVGAVFGLFSGIAIFIACMGLFGLVSYVALRRTREISIRKVLGATQHDVLSVLSADFFRLLGLAAGLAIGFGLWFTDAWLAAFANKASIGIWPYLYAVLIVLLLALITIGYRSWKVYTLNPSKTLKSE